MCIARGAPKALPEAGQARSPPSFGMAKPFAKDKAQQCHLLFPACWLQREFSPSELLHWVRFCVREVLQLCLRRLKVLIQVGE